MSKSLIKLIEYSLMPTALLLIGKLMGIFVTIRLFNIPISTKEYANQLFSSVEVSNIEDLRTITSFSDITMFVLISVYFLVVLFRAIYLHSTHAKPTLVAKLAKYNLLRLIQSSYELYHHAFVSLLFVLIATALINVNVINHSTYPWIGLVSLFVSFLLMIGLIFDVYKELNHIRKNPGSYEWV